MVSFIDRENEIDLLERAWNKDTAEFVVLYGRRRIGKTRLIVEFMKGKEGIFFVAEDTSKKTQITELKSGIAGYFDDDLLMRTGLEEWRDLFEYLSKTMPVHERIYLVIDEFSYILKNDPSVASALQKFWDTFLGQTKVFFMVSGSLFGLMSEGVLSSASPLYGRRTRDMLLAPLTFESSLGFLNMPFIEKMKIYMCTGGVPEYLLKATDYKSTNAFIKTEFLSRNGYFYREPYFILSQEFRAINTYFTILNAIAHGNTRPTEIANFIGIETRKIYPYLDNLIRLDFIERILPVPRIRKGGIYIIKDVFFDFWFNLVYDNREGIERGISGVDKNKINVYFGKRFEHLVREQIAHKISNFPHMGRWWYKDAEIDVVGLDPEKKRILFGECKWSDKVDAERIYHQLREKKELVEWNIGDRKEEYIIFARSFGKDFRARDLTLVDLKKMERLLTRG
jgi:AAA+ ATPase superfamily predicted ATPase